jgi:hypothetical protein
MTISTKTFQNLQPGVSAADDLRVRTPINQALQWLGEGLPNEINAEFASISASLSNINSALAQISQSVSVQIAAQIATISSLGKHKLWIPVKQMTADAVAGPAAGTVTATDVQYDTLDFDQTTLEYAHFNVSMPSSWNEGTVTFRAVWTAAAGTGDVVWGLQAAAASNDDVIAATYNAGVARTDTLIATGDLHRSDESPALTIDGTPAANDTVFFRFRRAATSGSDTLNADARLIGLEMYFTTDAAVDVA